MNEDVLRALKNKDNINKAKENLKKREKRAEEKRKAEIKEEKERQKRYENYIIKAKNNSPKIVNIIIKDFVDEYMKMDGRYRSTLDSDFEIFNRYNLDWYNYRSNNEEKIEKPYIHGEAYRCYESYNEKQEDDTKTVYYFLTNIEDSYYEYSWEPVIFDIEKMKSYNIFSDIILEDKKLRITAKYSAIRELIKKAGNKELEDVFDKSLLDFLKSANETIKDEEAKIKDLKETLIINTRILYKEIYENLKTEMAKRGIKDEYVISIKTFNFRVSNFPEIELYLKHMAEEDEEIEYCTIKIDNKTISLLIEIEALKKMLEQDREYGYLGIENDQFLKITFDGKAFDSFLASLEDNEPAEEIDKGQAMTLHRKD